MSGDLQVILQGFDRAQQTMLRAVRATEPKGALGESVKDALLITQRYAAAASHVWTGTLKRSHLIEWDGGSRGIITPSPYNINPRSKTPPSVYGPYEAARGGAHDFYALAVTAAVPRIPAVVNSRIERYIAR